MTAPPYILSIDIGNTNTKWGLFTHHRHCLYFGNNPNTSHPTELFQLANQYARGLHSILVSNVADPKLTQRLQQHFPHHLPSLRLIHVPQQSAYGITCHYQPPQSLGTDRWLNAIAVQAAQKTPALIVSLGTATTIDWVNAQGHFCGGYILAGLSSLRQALPSHLQHFTLPAGKSNPLPENGFLPLQTQQAIQIGALQATTSLIQHTLQTLQNNQIQPIEMIFTGGDAQKLQEHWKQNALPHRITLSPNLVLQGLLEIALCDGYLAF